MDHKTCLLVMGMHRSGTSALTGILNLLGIELGSLLLPPTEDNAKGYFENQRILSLNEALFKQMDSSWDDIFYKPSQLSDKVVTHFSKSLKRLIEHEFDNTDIFAIKDPRVCLLFPLYEVVLRSMGIGMKILLPYRHPSEVANSLLKRENCSFEKGLLLWVKHVLHAEYFSRPYKRVFTGYHTLIKSPESVIEDITQVTGIDFKQIMASKKEELADFIDSDLRHHVTAMEDTEGLPRVVCSVMECLKQIGNEKDMRDGFDRIRNDLETHMKILYIPELRSRHVEEAPNLLINSKEVTAPQSVKTPVTETSQSIVAYLSDPFDKGNYLDLALNILSPIVNLKSYSLEPLLEKHEGRYSFNRELLSKAHSIIVYDKAAYFSHLIPDIKTCGIPILFFIANDVCNVDTKHPQKEELDLLRHHYSACIEEADIVLAANKNLGHHITRDYTVIPSYIDPSPWKLPINTAPKKTGKCMVAVYVEKPHFGDFPMLAKFMGAIHKKFADELYFVVYVLNGTQNDIVTFPFAEIKFVRVSNYIEYINFVRSQPVDIVLTPLVANNHNQTVSPYNYFVHALCGVPGVYSNTGLYKNTVQHGTTGFLCNENQLDWESSIVTLMRDPELRKNMADEAKKHVSENFTMHQGIQNFNNILAGLKGSKQENRNIPDTLTKPMTRYELNSYLKYPVWCDVKALQTVDITMWEALAETWKDTPEFHFFLAADEGKLDLLANTIESLIDQLYPQWNLYIISRLEVPNTLFKEHPKMHWIQTETSEYDAANHAVSQMKQAMVGFLQAGDQLLPHALTAYCQVFNSARAGLVYTDHDNFDTHGLRIHPQFKPDFNIDMFRSKNYISRSFVISSTALSELEGINTEMADCELYDLILRYIDHFGEQSIGHYADVLHSFTHNGGTLIDIETISSKIALKQHLLRNNFEADIVEGPGNTLRVLYQHETTPMVSIIIPTKNQVDFLKPCVNSILEKTGYPHYELIIVDNGSDEEEAVNYLGSLDTHDQIKIVDYRQPFNYSTANNIGAEHACGEFLLFLNNDTEILHENWLDVLLSYGQRKDVGIVGPRLVYPNQTIQHAGVIVGLSTIADHQFIGSDLQDPGYMSRLQVDQDLSAVTAAAMLVKRGAFDAVKGLDDKDYMLNFSDVDFCLKVQKAGYKIIFTPHATLLHHGSITQKKADPEKAKEKKIRFENDKHSFCINWSDTVIHDPAYNVNLDTGNRFMEIRSTALAHWNPLLRSPLPKIFGMARNRDGGGYYRVISPLDALQTAGRAQTAYVYKNYAPQYIMQQHPDIIVYQTPLHDNTIKFLAFVKTHYPDVTLIFEIDDLLTKVPVDSRAFSTVYKDARKRIQRALKYCDRMVVSTQPLKDAFTEFIDDIRVIPNYLSRSVWGSLESKRNRSKKLRVGWAGSFFHKGDLDVISHLVTTYRDRVDWVFFGMAPEGLEDQVEFHTAVPVDQYPEKLAGLDLDLAMIPLEQHPFNEAKSNLRLLEFGILGWPVICSDIYPYQEAPVTRVKGKNRYKEWEKAFLSKIENPEKLPEEGDRLKAWVEKHYMLEDHTDFIFKQYTAKHI